jgi:hypothetical protein
VASANLNYERTDHAALAAWLLSGDGPDVIALQEFTESAMVTVTTATMVFAKPLQAAMRQTRGARKFGWQKY